MSIKSFPYKYFSGANVQVTLGDEKLIECAGISFVVNESNQPVYGYASHLYDVVLPGRRIIQGSFVVNFHTGKDQHEVVKGTLNNSSFLQDRILFDIRIQYGMNNAHEIYLTDCFLISRGQSIQISENVILEEFGFIARNMVGSNVLQR